MRSLFCNPDNERGRGTPVTNLTHGISFQSEERSAPSSHGIANIELRLSETWKPYVKGVSGLRGPRFDLTQYIASETLPYFFRAEHGREIEVTKRGVHMALQRLLSVAFGIGFVTSLWALPWVGSLALLVLSLAIYVFWPVPRPAEGAMLYRRGPAVIGPDLMGLVIVSGFIGMPLLVSRLEGGLHPTVLLVWPLGAIFSALLVIGWKRGVFALRITPDGLQADTGLRHVFMSFRDIAAIEPWRGDLVRWFRPLAPLLVASGNPGAAGALMVSRESRGVALVRRDGTRWIIPGDAFEAGQAALLKACAEHGVPSRRAA